MVRTKLQRRRRNAARISLYASLFVVGAGAAALYPSLKAPRDILNQAWHRIDFESLPEVQRLQRLVQVDTTAQTGNEIEAAEYLASEIEAAGIRAQVVRVGKDKANLYAILEGEDPRALVLHNHLDVDPVTKPDEWKYPPFSGAIEPPWIFGRGVFDMKSVAIAQLQAFLQLKELGRPLRRSVIFLATSSEETGSDLGTRWLLRTHPELVARFWAVLTEGGVLEATSRTDIKYWGTEFGQKRFVHVLACSPSRERLELLAHDLRDDHQKPPHPQTAPAVETFLGFYAGTRLNPDFRIPLERPAALSGRPQAFRQLPAYLKALFRNEVHPFPVEEDPQGGGYRMRLSLHLLPGTDLESALPQLLPRWMTHGVALTFRDPTSDSYASPLDHPVFQTILATLEERFGEIDQGPYFLPFSATDARFFRGAGIPTYGFTPFLLLADSQTMSGVNEQLALPAYLEGVELYVDLVERLVTEPDSGVR